MDEVDVQLLESVVELLHKNRQNQWVDLHNLRVIQYGKMLHVDAHMTLPWYYNLIETCREVGAMEQLIKSKFDNQVEFFIHVDNCLPQQCNLCLLSDCPERKEPFKKQVDWNMENLWIDKPHGVS